MKTYTSSTNHCVKYMFLLNSITITGKFEVQADNCVHIGLC